MTNYVQITSFGPKDALTTGDPNKKVKGTEYDAEFAAIATAIASKLNTSDFSSQSITESQITDGTLLARVGSNETITGSWTFNSLPALSSGNIWTSANDGASSGLDADLLDGQHLTYALARANHTGTQAANTISGGTFADALIAASNVTQHQGSLAIAADQTTSAIRNVAGTTDTPTSTDEEDIVTLSSASPTTVTLNSGVCGVGNSIAFVRLGAGTVTFAAGASQTIRSPGSRLTIPEQYGTVVATYIATNTWLLGGV